MRFSVFCDYLAQIEATSSRLAITDVLAKLFGAFSKEEIRPGCYLLSGRLTPKFEGLEFQFAEKMMVRAAESIVPGNDIAARFKQVGDLGDAIAESVPEREDHRSLLDIYVLLTAMAKEQGEGSQERKLQTMASLLEQASPQTAKYLVRIVLGTLRLGFSDMTMLDALSWAKAGDKSLRKHLELAFQIRADMGSLAELFLTQGEKALDSIEIELGVPISPALCQRLDNADEMIEKMGKVFVEPKYDGTRVLIHLRKKDGGWRVRTFTRNLEESSGMFPELLHAINDIQAEEIVLDSEAVGYDPSNGSLRKFQETIQRKRKHGVAELAETVPLRFFVFDILYKDGVSLLQTPLFERKKILEAVIKEDQVFAISPYIVTEDPGELRSYHIEQLGHGLEGVVIKQYASVYQPGRRGWSWVKFKEEEGATGKLSDTIDCVVMGYYAGQGKRTGFGVGAFLVGVRKGDGGGYATIAKIGTGLTDVQWQELYDRCQTLKVDTKPEDYDVHAQLQPDAWVKPALVAEIAADELTDSPVHTAGKALRFPRLVRFRDDKGPEQATELSELAGIA